ncbi:MAG: hypothetical protein HY747_07210 [Elusimicrobia bacterium]|nr:hypothetical protein [Elusimicrobiota bacterium]
MKLAFKDFFLKADQIKTPVYFFTGPNDFLKLRAKERLLSRPDFAGFSKIRMEGAGFDVQSLWEGLNTSDLFSNGEIYIVEKTDRLNAASKRSLLEVLDDFEEKEGISKIIVFISESDRQDITDPLEGHLLANQNACHIFFPALTEAEALSWAICLGQSDKKSHSLSRGPASIQFGRF